MAWVMTFDTLSDSVSAYCERDDSTFVDKIPQFIALAENRIASEIHNLGQRRAVTGRFSLNEPVVPKPVRWRETIEFSYVDLKGERKYLLQRGYGYLRLYWPDRTKIEAPKYYGDYDYEHWLVAPAPDSDYEFEIQYHERPEPLDETNQVSWNTQYAPQLILFATLLEAAPFLMRPDLTQQWQVAYQQAAAQIINEGQSRVNGDQSNLRSEG